MSGLTWHVGSKKTVVGTVGTPLCPGPHPGVLVRATANGAVRSNAVKMRTGLVLRSRSPSPVVAEASVGHGTATVWVTRDRGAHVLYAGRSLRGSTGIQPSSGS